MERSDKQLYRSLNKDGTIRPPKPIPGRCHAPQIQMPVWSEAGRPNSRYRPRSPMSCVRSSDPSPETAENRGRGGHEGNPSCDAGPFIDGVRRDRRADKRADRVQHRSLQTRTPGTARRYAQRPRNTSDSESRSIHSGPARKDTRQSCRRKPSNHVIVGLAGGGLKFRGRRKSQSDHSKQQSLDQESLSGH